MKKDLLKMLDLTPGEIESILNLGDQMKYNNRHGLSHRPLEGKNLAMIFRKASTRTRVSFEVGMVQLGGYALCLNSGDIQLGRGEPICDTAAVLSRYCDGIMIRTFAQQEVEDLARYASVPVINGLTDFSHPCQILADLMTIRERLHKLQGLKLCYIGDGNNMANSLTVGALKCGMSVSLACPEGYHPDPAVLAFAKDYPGFALTGQPKEAAENADVVVTDVWTSMGQEEETEARWKAFAGYQVNDELMKLARPHAMVQHCLPAHRGEEISAEIFEKHQDEIFDEAENRLHVQKAVMAMLMADRP